MFKLLSKLSASRKQDIAVCCYGIGLVCISIIINA